MLLHCVSKYPTQLSEVNLARMQKLQLDFGLSVGFSDHTQGIVASVTAVALGASVIEKHFTLDRHLDGPDHKLSADKSEMKSLVKMVRQVALTLSSDSSEFVEGITIQQAIRRSLVARRDIFKGEVFTDDMIAVKRPGYGLQPKQLPKVVGKIAARDIKIDALLSVEDIATVNDAV